jgi:hypothetical protein
MVADAVMAEILLVRDFPELEWVHAQCAPRAADDPQAVM